MCGYLKQHYLRKWEVQLNSTEETLTAKDKEEISVDYSKLTLTAKDEEEISEDYSKLLHLRALYRLGEDHGDMQLSKYVRN